MIADKPIEKAGSGHRHKMTYFGENFYLTITEESFDLSYSSDKSPHIEDRTKTGFDIISGLATQLLQDGTDYEDIASIFFQSSRKPGDLADSLCKGIEAEILAREEPHAE